MSGLLVYRRSWQRSPFFLAYVVWCLLSDLFFFLASHALHLNYATYTRIYIAETVLNSALQFTVLVELAVCIFRPVQIRPSLRLILLVTSAILLLGSAVWPIVPVQGLSTQYTSMLLTLHLQQTVTVLRILIFLVLTMGSQWLAIGWRNRELQIATGLGGYSLINLAVMIIQTQFIASAQNTHWIKYQALNELVSFSYFLTLLYWIVCFTQKEAERGELPQRARQALQMVAGQARMGREVAISTRRKPLD